MKKLLTHKSGWMGGHWELDGVRINPIDICALVISGKKYIPEFRQVRGSDYDHGL